MKSRRNRWNQIALASAILVAISTPAMAQPTIYVSPGGDDTTGDGSQGNPYGTVAKGIAEVPAGGTVSVAPGLYEIDSRMTIDKSLTLQGPQVGVDPRPYSDLGKATAGTTRTIDDPSTEAILDGTNGGFFINGLFLIEASDVTITGFQFSNANGDLIQAPDAIAQQNITVSYNIISNILTDDAVQLRNTDNGLVEYNYILDTVQDAINLCCGSTNGVIRYNEIANNASENAAIYIYDALPDDNVLNHEIYGNWIYNCTVDDAVELGAKGGGDVGDSGLIFRDNVVGLVPVPLRADPNVNPPNVLDDGMEVHLANVQTSGNLFTGVIGDSVGGYDGAVSIEDDTSDVCVLENIFIENYVTNPVGGGLSLDPSANGSTINIHRNTFIDNSPYAFVSRNNEQTAIRWNKFVDNTLAINARAGSNLLIEGNQFSGSDVGDTHVFANGQFGSLVFQGNEVYSGYVYLSNAVYESPAPTIAGNWYDGNYDLDLDNNGLIDGLDLPVTDPTAPQVLSDFSIVAQLDRDVDGLSDAFELYSALGFSFRDFDSDNDGFPDGQRIDPCDPANPLPDTGFVLNADTDGDGLVDFYESNRLTAVDDANDKAPLGDLDGNGAVGLADAVRSLQIVNGAFPYELASGDVNAMNVTGINPRSLANPLQILKFQATVRLGLPAVPGVD